MRFLWLASIVWSSLLLAGNPEQDINVNTRYTVERVDIAGDNPAGLSTGLRGELTRLVGARLNPAALDDLATRIRREVHVRAGTDRLLCGWCLSCAGRPRNSRPRYRNSFTAPMRAFPGWRKVLRPWDRRRSPLAR